MRHIFSSLKEALYSVIPIALIVLILSVTCVPLDTGVLVMFVLGTAMLILGMSFFTVGTVIKGRLANLEHFASLKDVEVNDERELLCILAPTKISGDIMNVINESFGITSPANGIVFALPTEKAYKI